jgi:hypothetical protein
MKSSLSLSLSLSMILASAVAGDTSLDLSDMPVSLCGWPSLHTTGKFPEWNTRLAQYLLGFALGEVAPVVDGVFSDLTTEEINKYQAQVGLEVNGYLNGNTWPSLVGEVSPLVVGASGLPVQALQDSLTANGYTVEVTGQYDEATKTALGKFQVDRGASIVSGEEVDDQTWHLLTTECNITTPGHYWFDAGRYIANRISSSSFYSKFCFTPSLCLQVGLKVAFPQKRFNASRQIILSMPLLSAGVKRMVELSGLSVWTMWRMHVQQGTTQWMCMDISSGTAILLLKPTSYLTILHFTTSNTTLS